MQHFNVKSTIVFILIKNRLIIYKLFNVIKSEVMMIRLQKNSELLFLREK